MSADKLINRLATLKSEDIDEAQVQEIYGLSISDRTFEKLFAHWVGLRKGRKPMKGGKISRYSLETFFMQVGLNPIRHAAASLGMTQESLEEVLAQIVDQELLSPTVIPELGGQLIASKLDKYLIESLPELQNRTFGDYNSFCRRLHAALKNKLGVTVTPAYCVTSQRLQEANLDYARDICRLTDQPIGLRYALWLNLGKPISLPPDKCSYLVYFEEGNSDIIKQYLMEDPPVKPEKL